VEGRAVEIRGKKQRELLAILIVHANEVVSTDRLIDALWEEGAPHTGRKALQVYVSGLRKILGKERLRTRAPGYSLALGPDALDSERFATLLEDGRRALAAGEPDRASDILDLALALWHGPALADFTYASFAQEEIARLEELRVAALEERVEAALALGRHAETVVELEALVAKHTLRERPRAQLMLALYRSGRQAEALQVYQEGRRALSEELGLEPSQSLQQLERRILEHDAALAPAARPARSSPTRSRRPLATVVAAAVVLLVVGIGAVITRADQNDSVSVSAGAAALDSETGEILERVPLGSAPGTVAIGEDSVWVLDADDKTISQIDPESRDVVRTFSTSSTPTDIAVGAGAVWVGNASRGSPLPESVSRFDTDSSVPTATIELAPRPLGQTYGLFGAPRRGIAVSPDAVWVVAADESLYRIDPRTNKRVGRIDVEASDVATGEGDVWVTDGSNLVEIDPARNTVARRIPLDSSARSRSAGALSGLPKTKGSCASTRTHRLSSRPSSSARGSATSRSAKERYGRRARSRTLCTASTHATSHLCASRRRHREAWPPATASSGRRLLPHRPETLPCPRRSAVTSTSKARVSLTSWSSPISP
jgi:DNA-binding SARP family transcriptional activator